MGLNVNAVGMKMGPETFEWTVNDVILYALGIGAEPDELQFVYEKNIKVLPTFAVIPVRGGKMNTTDALGLDYAKLLHGENRIELYKPLPAKGKITATNSVKAIYDKGAGKGAVVVAEIEARDESGDLLFKNIPSIFVRGEGGWGGDRGPSGPKNVPPDRAPDKVVSMKTNLNQAQLYRLCGDANILHVDPQFAQMAGFPRPILHGLCTYGHVARAALKSFGGNEPASMKWFEARFAGVVYPGDTITTEMWDAGEGRVIIRAKTGEDNVVINGAAAQFA